MENKLNILLSALEMEEKNLVKSISDFIEEEEYEYAFLQSKALWPIRQKIFFLKKLDDPSYENKLFLQTRITNLYKKLSVHLTDHYQQYLLKEIEDTERELETLLARRAFELENPKPTIIDQTILDLLARKIKCFSLTFSKNDKLTLFFTYNHNKLTLRMPGIKRFLRSMVLDEYQIDKALAIGFEKIKNNTELRLIIKPGEEDINLRAIRVLALITFEMLNGVDNFQESFITIEPAKPN